MPKNNVKYTPEMKAEFVARLISNDGNFAKTARELQIPETSLKRIASHTPAPIAVRVNAIQKEKFVKGSWEVINKALKELKAKLKFMEPDKIRALSNLIATLYDKQSHAMVEPQVRKETLSVNRTISDHTKRVVQQFEDGSGLKIIDAREDDLHEQDKEKSRRLRHSAPA